MNDREWLNLHGSEYWKSLRVPLSFAPNGDDFWKVNRDIVKKCAEDCKASTGDTLDITEIEDHAWDVLSGETSPVKYSGGTSSCGYVTAEGTLMQTSEKKFVIGTFSGLKPEDLCGNLSPEQMGLVVHWLGHPIINPLDYRFWQKVAELLAWKVGEYLGDGTIKNG